MKKPMFEKVALIGVGLIGSSLSHAMRRANLAGKITACARSEATRATIRRLELADEVFERASDAVRGADLVVTAVAAARNAARSMHARLMSMVMSESTSIRSVA